MATAPFCRGGLTFFLPSCLLGPRFCCGFVFGCCRLFSPRPGWHRLVRLRPTRRWIETRPPAHMRPVVCSRPGPILGGRSPHRCSPGAISRYVPPDSRAGEISRFAALGYQLCFASHCQCSVGSDEPCKCLSLCLLSLSASGSSVLALSLWVCGRRSRPSRF